MDQLLIQMALAVVEAALATELAGKEVVIFVWQLLEDYSLKEQ